jgi:hypothetical protein
MPATTVNLKNPIRRFDGREHARNMDKVAERRGTPRWAFTAGANVVEPVSGAELHAHTTDLSRGGCYVDTMSPFPTGTEMHLRLTKDNTSFHTKARVIYCQSGVGMGLLFTEIAPAQQPILERWLAELRGDTLAAPTASEKDNSSSMVAPRSGERYVIEDLVAMLMQKFLLTEDEGETILRRLRE